MGQNSIVGLIFRPILRTVASSCPHNKLGNEVKMSSTVDIEENDEHSHRLTSTRRVPWVVEMWAVSIKNFVVCFRNHVQSTMFHLR
jgi:hypothetical protein